MTEADLDAAITDDLRRDTWAVLDRWQGVVARVLNNDGAGQVLNGPFAGMAYEAEPSVRDALPKTVGCYEEELHGAFEKAIALNPAKVINVGSAEGYYTVGLARRLPQARILAYEMQRDLWPKIEKLASSNDVSERIEIRGMCRVEDLAQEAGPGTLVLMDCEGGEVDLLDPIKAPGLAQSIIILELHEFIKPGVTKDILMRFVRSHKIETIEATGRDPYRYPDLRELSSFLQMLAVCEYRPAGRMQWMLMIPHGSQA